MSTLKATNLSHASAASPNIVLDSAGKVTFGGAVAGAGMDLITPTSVAGTGVTVSGGAVSFSAATTVSVNGCFTSTYDNYRIILSVLPTVSNDADIRLRVGGTDNSTASSYVIQRLSAGSTTVTAARTTSSAWAAWQANTAQYNSASFEVFRPFIVGTTQLQTLLVSSDTNAYMAMYVGTHNQSVSYDGISFIYPSGTITGTLRVYGYRNS